MAGAVECAMSSQSFGEDAMDLLHRVAEKANDLYRIRDTYFPMDESEKNLKLQQESELALKLLDSFPPELRKSSKERAVFEYLRGKILDVFSGYSKEAEDNLSKAVKLNPSLSDAWLCLGNCLWKKEDLLSARNCFTLALRKGTNKNILCQLSMLERKLAQSSENPAKLVEESIQHAKEATTLDVKDGNSWYILGNAYLTGFFVTGAWDNSRILQSLKAYQVAEKDAKMNCSPDLYFNRAIADRYMENYESALSGFGTAALKDPGLNACDEVRKMVNLLDKIECSLRGKAKAEKLTSLTSSMASVSVKSTQRGTTINDLSEGLNKGVAIGGKVLQFIVHGNVAPLYYVVCDPEQICFVLSVYDIDRNALKEGDQITVFDPCYHYVDFPWKEKSYQFKSIRIEFLEQIAVNGKRFSKRGFRASVHAQHKS